MSRLRRSVLQLLALLTFYFTVPRLGVEDGGHVVNIQRFVYILGVAIIALTLTMPILRRIPVALSLFLWTAVYLICKLGIFYQSAHPLLGDENTFVSLVEIAFIWLSDLLTRQVAEYIHDFEETLENITFADAGHPLRKPGDVSEAIQTELVRSRRHHHPLAIIVVEPERESIRATLNRTIQEVQRAMMTRYVVTRLGRVINQALRRTDVLMKEADSDRFIILCPETDTEGSAQLMQRIQSFAAEGLGVQVKCASSAFPEEALTFDSLVREATLRLAQTALPPIVSISASASVQKIPKNVSEP